MKGYCVGYAADAMVYHSHSYTMAQEFKRHFDLGFFLRRSGGHSMSWEALKGWGLSCIV